MLSRFRFQHKIKLTERLLLASVFFDALVAFALGRFCVVRFALCVVRFAFCVLRSLRFVFCVERYGGGDVVFRTQSMDVSP